MSKIELYPLSLPVIDSPTDLVQVLAERLDKEGYGLQEGDVVVITSKYVLKARGDMVKISDVRPKFRARAVAKLTGKDPAEVQIILDAARKVLFYAPTSFIGEHTGEIGKDAALAARAAQSEPAVLFTITKNGFITTDSGLDYSNIPSGYAVVNTADFDSIARWTREKLEGRFGVDIAVVITDTEFTLSNGKFGSMDFAVGASGIMSISREFGSPDLYGRPKFGGLDIIVDEISAAAALMMKQSAEGIPAVLIRGLAYEKSDEGVGNILISRYGKTARKVALEGFVGNLIGKLVRIL